MTIKEFRKLTSCTQLDVARAVNISIQQYQKIEQGKILLKNVKYNTVSNLYYFLRIYKKISLEEFVKDNDITVLTRDI